MKLLMRKAQLATATAVLMLGPASGVILLTQAPAHALYDDGDDTGGGGGGGGGIDNQVVEIVGTPIRDDEGAWHSVYDVLEVTPSAATPIDFAVPEDEAPIMTLRQKCSWRDSYGRVLTVWSVRTSTFTLVLTTYWLSDGRSANEISESAFQRLYNECVATTSK